MTSASEWSQAFDMSWNNITSNQAPGLNEYEKSYYLTRAQNELVKNWYIATSKGNNLGAGFDETTLRQMDFSNLIVTKSSIFNSTPIPPTIDLRALVFNMPSENTVIAIVNEQIGLYKTDTTDTTVDISKITTTRQVIPVSYAEYLRLMSKPFKEPLKWQAWRLLSNKNAEIILNTPDKENYNNKVYTVRYVKKPAPIILAKLSDYDSNLKIEGKDNVQNPVCELNGSAHEAILQRAVELAKLAWEGDASATQLHISSGDRSN